MSEIMTPIPFDRLIRWMTEEYKTKGSVFGIKKEKFYKKSGNRYRIFGRELGSPLGAAAGPNTQLAQNIVAGYVSGLRFMELKTVQTMDGEEMRKCIARPCIYAQDEGYNVEWSTELTVRQAFDEYVKAWFALHVAAREFGISDTPDFVFNMSVGYTYEGITSKKIDDFISDMTDARNTAIFDECREHLLSHIDMFSNIDREYIESISSRISESITLSTLHGCPPEEIEKIANHFLMVKKLHTYVKCNPTLLGYEFVRNILDDMGYGYVSFDRRHFDADLKFQDAVALIGRLRKTAADSGLVFGVKLTNTFPVQIKEGELPGEFMYMSGRALFPLSINVALKLSEAFQGSLPVSFSGGADYFNIDSIIKTGIAPVTVATAILKPGGYMRAKQMNEKVEPIAVEFKGIDIPALKELAEQVKSDKHHLKWSRETKSRKISSPLPLFDCFTAPCSEGGCPIRQQIPQYLSLVAKGEYKKAFEVIAADNALPAVTSEICSHACQTKCTRIDYDEPLKIRSAKNLAVRNAQRDYIERISKTPLRTGKRVAVIGAGPAGLSAGLYLRRNGVTVTVFEKLDKPFGIVQYVIPAFRVSEEALRLDYDMAVKTGVEFRFGVDENYDIKALKREFDYVIIATGAWNTACPVKEGADKLLDALMFLKQSKLNDCKVKLGKHVAVIGGGDVAMDCARAAKRAPGVESVDIIYRRTREYMPSSREEQELALLDGVKFYELLSPLSYDGKNLVVERMELGEKAADGRRSFVPTGRFETLAYDTVISAVGSRPDAAALKRNGICMAGDTYPVLNENNETSIGGVYIAGDCSRGPATIVQAMADSKTIALDILNDLGLPNDFDRTETDTDSGEIYERKAVLCESREGECDAARCLSCGQICEICCEVCPNRANISLLVNGKPQILHIDGMCNECGNCAVFCPYQGAPYRDKITLFNSREEFSASDNKGFVFLDDGLMLVRDERGNEYECGVEDEKLPPMLAPVIRAIRGAYRYIV
ncbi:MAG: putative selenate reductase subunit YgfK [Burkholderiales bacterium]